MGKNSFMVANARFMSLFCNIIQYNMIDKIWQNIW